MKEITFEITNFCPFGCKYCSSNNMNERKLATFLKVDTLISILDGKHYDRINISGGEPLSHPNIYDIIVICREHADDVILYTNMITHLRYNANVIDGVYLECNLPLLPEVDKVHILRRVKQGRELNRPEVHLSRNYKEDCSCDHRVVIPNGEIVMTPCNKHAQPINQDAYKNRIYISGSHGVGKSTLIKDSEISLKIRYYKNDTKNPYTEDVKMRQLWRLYKYKTDEGILKMFVNERIIVNRCVLDWLVYTETFKELGWLSNGDYNFLINRYNELFNNEIPENIVFLNPPREWSEERIIERWEGNKMKWREDNFSYYDVLRDKYDDVFENISSLTNVIEVNDTTKSVRINNIKAILSA